MRIAVCDDNQQFLSEFEKKVKKYCAIRDWE